jgi:hypothetical protein
MKLRGRPTANKLRLSIKGYFRWYHKDAKKIKQGITYRHMLSHFWTPDVDPYEIYSISEKDKTTQTYWLVEHKVLNLDGKLEFIPMYEVELDKQATDFPEFWSVKRVK